MLFCFFFKQKTAYEMRISDWSSDVCSSDLARCDRTRQTKGESDAFHPQGDDRAGGACRAAARGAGAGSGARRKDDRSDRSGRKDTSGARAPRSQGSRSEEQTSELQSLMRTSYADFCLNKKNLNYNTSHHNTPTK